MHLCVGVCVCEWVGGCVFACKECFDIWVFSFGMTFWHSQNCIPATRSHWLNNYITCIARILQWINNLHEWCNKNHLSFFPVIITSFLQVVYQLKNPSLTYTNKLHYEQRRLLLYYQEFSIILIINVGITVMF